MPGNTTKTGSSSHIVINSSYLMRPDQRIVTKIPLTELWDEKGALPGERIRQLDENLIRGLMGTGQVQFIVANCGEKLNWIPMSERFEFWKTVRPQVAAPSQPVHLKQFPNETAYVASEWRGNTGECLILLEAHH
jgi:hypothetical protein